MHFLRRPKTVLERSVAAQAVLSFVLIAVVIKLVRWDLPVVLWLIESAALTAVSTASAVWRRRRDRAALGGISVDQQLAVERQLARGHVPQEPRERDAMRRLVGQRLRRMNSLNWTFVPLLVLLVAASAAFAALGMWTFGMVWLVCSLVFDSWVLYMRNRNLALLRRMDHELAA